MSKYCVACGEALGGRFCGACGQAATDSSPIDAAVAAAETLSPLDSPLDSLENSRSAASPKRRLRIGALSAGAAVLTSVAVLTGLAMNSQAAPQVATDPAAHAAGATAVKTVTKSADISQKRLLRAKVKARAEREAAAAQAAATTSTAALAPNSSGSWAGSLADGKYSYYLEIEESGGSVAGSMYQVSNVDGDSGTEYPTRILPSDWTATPYTKKLRVPFTVALNAVSGVTGYREGNTLYLQGQYWTGAPSNWGLDSFTIELSSDGESMWGSYNCDVCSTTNNLSGERSYGDY